MYYGNEEHDDPKGIAELAMEHRQWGDCSTPALLKNLYQGLAYDVMYDPTILQGFYAAGVPNTANITAVTTWLDCCYKDGCNQPSQLPLSPSPAGTPPVPVPPIPVKAACELIEECGDDLTERGASSREMR